MRRLSPALVCLAVLVLASGGPARAGATPNGAEFHVNTYTTSSQSSPAVAMGDSGEFVVVWMSYTQDGDHWGIFGQLFDSAGAPVAAEFQVNSYTTGSQFEPSVAMGGSGEFVVVWTSYWQDGSYEGVFGRRFDSSANPAGGEFQVSTYTTSYQEKPSVAMGAAGEFVVTWQGDAQDGSTSGIFGKRFNSAGTPLSGEFQVNTYTTSYQRAPSVGIGPSGEFVVAWMSFEQDELNWGVFGQRFDSAGGPVGTEFHINTYTTAGQVLPKIALGGSGEFVVIWDGSYQDGSLRGVFGQLFDSAGSPVGAEFQANTYTTLDQMYPSVGMGGNGEFIVAWQSTDQDGSTRGVFGQLFDNTGSPVDAEFQVNVYTTNSQRNTSVDMNGSGEFVVTWHGVGDVPDDNTGVFGGRFLGCSVEQCDGIDNDCDGQTDEDFNVGQACSGIGQCAAGTTECSAGDPNGTQCSTHPGGSQDQSAAETCDGMDNDCDGQTDEGGVCGGPFAIIAPMNGQTVDCTDPASIRPTFAWSAGAYDKFKIFMGSSPGFEKKTRVTSGKPKPLPGTWMPSKKKWKKACKKAIDQAANPASPLMYISIFGIDRDVSKKDPLRKAFTPTVTAEVQH